MSEGLIKKYETERFIYEAYEKKCVGIVEELLSEFELQYHVIESRVKTIESFKNKVKDKRTDGEEVTYITDITDIVGLRIITFYEDIVDEITNMLKPEFKVDEKNSIDKRNKDDRFGYSSVHLILELNNDRVSLPENKKFKGLKFEIQIRSLLQHAWAVVSHELKYKNEKSFPEEMSRKLARQSGMLEEVDDNFRSIRDLKEEYSKKVHNDIEKGLLDSPLNEISLENYLISSRLVSSINSSMMKILNEDAHEIYSPHNLSLTLEKLLLININTLKELDDLLKEKENKLPDFFKQWLNINNKKLLIAGLPGLPRDTLIYYLCLMVLIEKKDTELYEKYALNFISNTKDEIQAFVENARKMEAIWS